MSVDKRRLEEFIRTLPEVKVGKDKPLRHQGEQRLLRPENRN